MKDSEIKIMNSLWDRVLIMTLSQDGSIYFEFYVLKNEVSNVCK